MTGKDAQKATLELLQIYRAKSKPISRRFEELVRKGCRATDDGKLLNGEDERR